MSFLARDIETWEPKPEANDRSKEFEARKGELDIYLRDLKPVDDFVYMIALNTGEAYFYFTKTGRTYQNVKDKGFYIQSFDQLINFILNKENKAFNRIESARRCRERSKEALNDQS